ncbi:aquaglyceroporin AqpS [Microcella alkalica]|uniref:Glycerol uptake facilitator-like aquaporin n=1 Tax=Microcella alkalica TaxID=355930 RepID=A0A839EAF2_9MICO|nr:aquaporin [Microcella alkalica]MBA8848216.1 glycerol uptake facilitator-like aquaporin [Microcella alkalica]
MIAAADPAPAPLALGRRALAEGLGAAGLAAVVIGSGVMATRLTDDVGVQLLMNAIATVFGLFVLIAALSGLSGAHLNPAVTLVMLALRRIGRVDAAVYIPAQVAGCLAGAALANLMFGLPAVALSTTDRAEPATLLAEVIATAGLIAVILLLIRQEKDALIAPAVAAYIGAAYFFTSSTSFANPAITIGRVASDTFAGIAPASAGPFIVAQVVGAAIALGFAVTLAPRAAGPRTATPAPPAETARA